MNCIKTTLHTFADIQWCIMPYFHLKNNFLEISDGSVQNMCPCMDANIFKLFLNGADCVTSKTVIKWNFQQYTKIIDHTCSLMVNAL